MRVQERCCKGSCLAFCSTVRALCSFLASFLATQIRSLALSFLAGVVKGSLFGLYETFNASLHSPAAAGAAAGCCNTVQAGHPQPQLPSRCAEPRHTRPPPRSKSAGAHLGNADFCRC